MSMSEEEKQDRLALGDELYEEMISKPEEFDLALENFDGQDMAGGLANVRPPDSFVQEMAAQEEEANRFIIPCDDPSKLPHKEDKMLVELTPEEVLVFIQALESLSVNMKNIPYLESEGVDLFAQQSFIREIRKKFDDTLMKYLMLRPSTSYVQFLNTWIKKIGKEKELKELDRIKREKYHERKVQAARPQDETV